jgi:hypothetical protein
MKTHPQITELALFASGDLPWLSRFPIGRHVRECPECSVRIDEFRRLREDLAETDLPGLDWNRMASEMRANIRLGLEAGECVRGAETARRWRLGLAAACACLLFLVGAGIFLHDSGPATPAAEDAQTATLRTTSNGVELRSGTSTLTLLNHDGSAASRMVSAQGAVRSRFVDGETGAVTINNVYLAQ